MNWKILPVGDILVRTEIAETPFKCDLKKCKGACCTIDSEFGAPLKKNEIENDRGNFRNRKSLFIRGT